MAPKSCALMSMSSTCSGLFKSPTLMDVSPFPGRCSAVTASLIVRPGGVATSTSTTFNASARPVLRSTKRQDSSGVPYVTPVGGRNTATRYGAYCSMYSDLVNQNAAPERSNASTDIDVEIQSMPVSVPVELFGAVAA